MKKFILIFTAVLLFYGVVCADDQCQNAFRNKNYDRTIQECTDLLKSESDSPDPALTYCTRADAYLNKKIFDRAIADYESCIENLERDYSPGSKDRMARALVMKGNAYLKLRKNDEALDAFTKAAEMSSDPAQAYFNLCATQYNTGNTEAAEAACGKAIAADPNKADAYFIKGSLGIAKGELNAQKKWIFPEGTIDALKKYLKLAPNGPHAADVREMLDFAGVK